MKKRHIPFLTNDGLWVRMLFLVGSLALGILIATLLSSIAILILKKEISSVALTPDLLRLIQFIQSISIFVVPAVLMAYFIAAKPYRYLQLTKRPKISQVVLTVASMLIMVPFMNQIITWNEAIRLPDFMAPIEHWMREKEDIAQLATRQLLDTSSWGIRFINLLLVGVTAAVAEELFFRGMLQNIFLDKWHKKLAAVLLSAFLFSAIHLQFYGFLPRFILGAYFGLLLIWTGSLWIPILAHFTNNTCALIQFYIEQDQEGKALLEATITAPNMTTELLLSGGSLLLFVWIAICIKKSGA